MEPIEELLGLIKDMSGGITAVKEKQEKMETELAAFREAVKKGFPIGGAPTDKILDELGETGWNMAVQGKALQDKLLHPGHQTSEEARQELAKYFVLVLRASIGQDSNARKEIWKRYGQAPELKTVIGDVGNVFPTPDIVEAEILAFAREKSAALQYGRILDMISDKQSYPQESASATVGWGNTTSESEPTIAEVELANNELSAYAAVRNTTLQDARSDIVSWLTENLGEAVGQELDNQAFNGDGTYFYGVLSSQCGFSVVMTGSTFAQISADELSLMISKLDGLRKQGARFWMNGVAIHYIRILKDSQQRPIFMEGSTVGGPVPTTIWGYPYGEVIKMPSTTAANTPWIAFGNLKYLGMGRRLDSGALMVDPYGLWTTNRTRFKVYQRWAVKMLLPKGFVRLLTHA